jgi:hypothetical protein
MLWVVDRSTRGISLQGWGPREYGSSIDATVDGLVARGVTFLRYDGMPHDERGIVREWGPPIAWFTDPAGNILSVLEQ